MRLSTLLLLKHLHGLLESITLCAPNSEKLFESSTVQESRFTAPALPLVSVTLGDKISHHLQVERPVMSRSEVVELDDERGAVRAERSFELELCLEERPCLVYRKGKPLF